MDDDRSPPPFLRIQIFFFSFFFFASRDNHCRYRSRDLHFPFPPCKARSRYLTYLPSSYWVAYLHSDTYLPGNPLIIPLPACLSYLLKMHNFAKMNN
jgi:hypothetical protein